MLPVWYYNYFSGKEANNERKSDRYSILLCRLYHGVNPNCGDDIWLKLKVENGIIEDGAFVGDGCAISQASADIMLGMIIGKSKEEALRLGKLFLRMIQGEADDEEIEQLEEASALKDIAHMPARVKCAVLGWHTLEEALKKL